MKGKNIEPGCLAIIVHAVFPENLGKVVKVASLHMQETAVNQRIWTVEFNAPTTVLQMGKLVKSSVAQTPESQLRRIDGDEDLSGDDVETGLDAKFVKDLIKEMEDA